MKMLTSTWTDSSKSPSSPSIGAFFFRDSISGLYTRWPRPLACSPSRSSRYGLTLLFVRQRDVSFSDRGSGSVVLSLSLSHDRPSSFNVIRSLEPGVFRLRSVRSRSPTYNSPSASFISSRISSSSSFLYHPSINYTSNGQRNVSVFVEAPRFVTPSLDDAKTERNPERIRSVGLGCLFSLGVLGTAITGLRLEKVVGLTNQDRTSLVQAMLLVSDIIKWSQLEVNVIITCANAPALVAIWKRLHESSSCRHRPSPTLSIISSDDKIGLDDHSTMRTFSSSSSKENSSHHDTGDLQTIRKGTMETFSSALHPEMDREIGRQSETKSFAGGGGDGCKEDGRFPSTMVASSRIAGLGHGNDYRNGNGNGIVQSTTVVVRVEPSPDPDPHHHHPLHHHPPADGRDRLGWV